MPSNASSEDPSHTLCSLLAQVDGHERKETVSEAVITRRIMFEPSSMTVPPIIRLKGLWLVKAGFIPGRRVEVVVCGSAELIIRQTNSEIEAARSKARALAAFAAAGL